MVCQRRFEGGGRKGNTNSLHLDKDFWTLQLIIDLSDSFFSRQDGRDGSTCISHSFVGGGSRVALERRPKKQTSEKGKAVASWKVDTRP